MGDLQSRLDRLSPEKRALLAKRLSKTGAQSGAGGSGLPEVTLEPGQRNEPFPLTDLQYAYWIGRGDAYEMGGIASKAYVELECADLDLDRAIKASD